MVQCEVVAKERHGGPPPLHTAIPLGESLAFEPQMIPFLGEQIMDGVVSERNIKSCVPTWWATYYCTYTYCPMEI